MTRDELHDRFIREGAFPGTPKGRGLINYLVLDAEVCEQATCEGCGHKGLEFVTYTDAAGDYRAAVAVCPGSVSKVEMAMFTPPVQRHSG